MRTITRAVGTFFAVGALGLVLAPAAGAAVTGTQAVAMPTIPMHGHGPGHPIGHPGGHGGRWHGGGGGYDGGDYEGCNPYYYGYYDLQNPSCTDWSVTSSTDAAS